jgi:hypothetical protein
LIWNVFWNVFWNVWNPFEIETRNVYVVFFCVFRYCESVNL